LSSSRPEQRHAFASGVTITEDCGEKAADPRERLGPGAKSPTSNRLAPAEGPAAGAVNDSRGKHRTARMTVAGSNSLADVFTRHVRANRAQ
jgi:hypothetical protein